MANKDGYAYVREHYGVDPRVGQRVTIDGLEATVRQGLNDQYLHVHSDTGFDVIAHPTWRVVYEATNG